MDISQDSINDLVQSIALVPQLAHEYHVAYRAWGEWQGIAKDRNTEINRLRTLIKNIEDYCYTGEHANVSRVARLCEDALA